MQHFRSWLKNLPIIGDLALWAYMLVTRAYRVDVAFWLRLLLPTSNAQIVQIGSNDGMTGDPISTLIRQRPGWRALFVEPIPIYFERLKRNYGDDPRFSFENVAIAEQEGQLTFYWVNEEAKQHLPDLPDYFNQLGSFNRSHIVSKLNGVLEPYIVSSPISAIRLGTLLERSRISQIDLLHTDAESYDYKIISQLDLTRYQPRLILFEHINLTAEEKRSAIQFLSDHYHLYYLGFEILAVHRRTGDLRLPLRLLESQRATAG
jgi:FkbM family methyltransferase